MMKKQETDPKKPKKRNKEEDCSSYMDNVSVKFNPVYSINPDCQ
jgi:hypothetical protein